MVPGSWWRFKPEAIISTERWRVDWGIPHFGENEGISRNH